MATCKSCPDASATTSTGTCASGSAVCDPRYATLPTASQIKLIGSDGECLKNLPAGSCGIVTFEDGLAQVSEVISQDLTELITYLQKGDGTLILSNGEPVATTPPVFDHLMVLKNSCSLPDCSDSKPTWYKWKGPDSTSGFVYWNGESFNFAEVNANGLVTTAALEKTSSAYLAALDDGTSPTGATDKTLGYFCPDNQELVTVSPTGVATELNPDQIKGLVAYRETSECDATITPQVVSLCELTNPACVEKPVPTNIVGCASDGDVASTGDTPALDTNHAGWILGNPGSAGAWANYQIGKTFYPGNTGTIFQANSASGSSNTTVSSIALSAAAGYTLPSEITHVIVQVRNYLRTTVGEARSLTVTVGGITVAETAGRSWGAPNEDIDVDTASAVVPVDGSGAVAINVNHSSSVGSTYDVRVDLLGAYSNPVIEI